MQKHLYVIADAVTEDISGTVVTARNEPEALRFFSDIISDPRTGPGQHPADHALIRVGILQNTSGKWKITPESTIVMTGEQWLATQPKEEQVKL